MPDKILIVDDDKNICEILEFNLKSEGFEVISVHSAEEALKVLPGDFSIILLDVMMGGMSGYKMAEKLRTMAVNVPIIFLTAKDTENDMLTGFSVGGDDYIPKPFSVKEVIARTKAVIKRYRMSADDKKERKIEFEGLVIDQDVKEVIINGTSISLTKTEFEILVLLVENTDRILSRQDIIDVVWSDTPYITERTVDVHITRLRKKLEEYGGAITSRSGYGYRFHMSEL